MGSLRSRYRKCYEYNQLDHQFDMFMSLATAIRWIDSLEWLVVVPFSFAPTE